MKNWQFCMLMATIYLAPVTDHWVNDGMAILFLMIASVAFLKDDE